MCVTACIHVHSTHVGSALYIHGSMGINCQMFAPTTFKVFRHLCSEELQHHSWLLQLREKEGKTHLCVLYSITPILTFCALMMTYVCESLITCKQFKRFCSLLVLMLLIITWLIQSIILSILFLTIISFDNAYLK